MFRPLQLRFRGTTGEIIPINATGGEVFDYPVPGTDEIYRYHVFGNSGTAQFEILNISNSFNNINVLCVSGGGAGGAADNETEGGGGGGAGGFREVTLQASSPAVFNVFVGAGGTGNGGSGNCAPGNPGGVSSFGTIESGRGGGGLPARTGDYGGIANGGSGGGGAGRSGARGIGNTPPTDPPQGFNGAFGSGNTGGGGGGASSQGSLPAGGSGKSSTIFNSLVKAEYKKFYTKEIGVGTSAVFSKGGQGGIGTSASGYVTAPSNSGNGGSGGYAAGERAGDPRQYMIPGTNGGSGAVVVRYRIQ